jgi:archaemetzincin
MPQILIIPVILEFYKLYNQNEQERYHSTMEADIYPGLINKLVDIFTGILTTINLCDTLILDHDSIVNSHLFDKSINRWNSDNILKWIFRRALPNSDTKILAICDFDAFSNSLNFVFGEAQMGGRVGAVYLPRLRQEFYGHIYDSDLFLQRITKETVHELGHLLRLTHCERRNCVMHFSNSLKDTDFKDYNFCDRCSSMLVNMYQ